MFEPHPKPTKLMNEVSTIQQRLDAIDEEFKALVAGQSRDGKPLVVRFDELLQESKKLYARYEEPHAQVEAYQKFSEAMTLAEDNVTTWAQVAATRAQLFELLVKLMGMELELRRNWHRQVDRLEPVYEKALEHPGKGGAKEVQQMWHNFKRVYDLKIRQLLTAEPLNHSEFWELFNMPQP